MRLLYYQGRVSRSVLRPLDVLLMALSACFMPECGHLCGFERSLGPRHLRRQGRVGICMGDLLPGALGVSLCRTRRAQGAAMVLCRAQEGQLVALNRGWRKLAPRRLFVSVRLFRFLYANRQAKPVGWCALAVPSRFFLGVVA